MELTLYLSQVIGVLLIIAGGAVLLRRCHYIPVVGGFVAERLVRMIIGILELLAGLFLTFGFFDVSSGPGVVITVLGWLLVVEGTVYLVLSDAAVARIIRVINTPATYVVGGITSVFLGLYLAGSGFGLF